MTTEQRQLNDNFPELKIEQMDDGLISLEQDNCGEISCVVIHRLHLRCMAEKSGLIATSDPQVVRTIETLERRMRLLKGRINFLSDWLTNHSDQDADLSYETTYAKATTDIVNEYCADMGEQS